MKPTVIIAAVALLSAVVFGGARLAAASPSGSSTVSRSDLAAVPTHMVGAFNLDNSSFIPNAKADGLQTSFHYDYYPGSQLEQSYQQNNILDINGRISQLMWDYECHRIHTVVTVPPGAWGFCSSDLYPSMDYNNLMSSVTSYLQQVAGDPTIHGYWVLDDWPYYDATAAQVLANIHSLVQQYTPGRPTVCGFAAFIIPGGYEWQSSLANNFTPQGCDEIAWYVYPDTSSSMPSANSYDWTMPGLLGKMTSDFKARGWNPGQTPLIGIPAAFGGQNKYDGSYQVVPTTQSVATQTQAFCQAGASSIAFYAWDLSDYNNPQDPVTNSAINAGVQQGVGDCQQIWNGSTASLPAATPPATSTPVPTNTPAPTSTPVPTNTPAPTSTPVPTSTAVPTSTPVTTSVPAPQPIKTPAPVPTAVPPSSAAVPVSFEAETSGLSGPVETDSYVSASQGRYIQFTTSGTAYAGCGTPSSTAGFARQFVSVPATSTYYIWSRITGHGDAGNSYWLQVDNRCPIDVGDLNGMGANYWQWVNYSNGSQGNVIAVQLTAGAHYIRMYDREPGVDLDRVIFTPNPSCVPTGTGDNCAPSTLGTSAVR
jgi:hypothetical protein